jgi:calcineurin-like phosphoesterase family protein
MDWFTADWHLGHERLMKVHCNRPFQTTEEMDEYIISHANEMIKPGDTLWLLGDFSWTNPEPYIKRLTCHPYLIPGNHDQRFMSRLERNMRVMPPIVDITFDSQSITMCHYPMASWNRSCHGSWMLHGHCHGTYKSVGFMMDVGVDSNGFKPVSLDQVREYMKSRDMGFRL